MKAPAFYLRIDGEKLPSWVIKRCKTFEYEGIAEKMNRVILKFENIDLRLLDYEPFDVAQETKLRFQFGYADGELTEPKEYVIQKNEGLKEITITAYQQKPEMSKKSRSVVYEQAKWSDVAKLVASRNGMAYEVEETKTVHEQIVQSNESDNKFLKQGADKIGYEYYVENGTVYFHSKDYSERPVRKFKYFPNDDEREKAKLLDITPKAKDVNKPPQETKKGFDPYEGKEFEANSNKDNTDRTTAGEGTYIYDKEGDEKYIPGKVEATEHPKQAVAEEETEGEFKKTEENVIEADAKLVGDPKVLEKKLIEITNIGQRYSGIYRVKRCRHIIGSSSTAYSLKVELTKNAYNKGGESTGAQVNQQEAPGEDEPEEATMYYYDPETGEEEKRPGVGGASL